MQRKAVVPLVLPEVDKRHRRRRLIPRDPLARPEIVVFVPHEVAVRDLLDDSIYSAELSTEVRIGFQVIEMSQATTIERKSGDATSDDLEADLGRKVQHTGGADNTVDDLAGTESATLTIKVFRFNVGPTAMARDDW